MAVIVKTNALVLSTSKWRESSKIVHMYSADYGYLKTVAKGAYRPKSPFRGVLESMNYIEAVVNYKENRGLQNLNSATLLDAFQTIREDLPKTAIALSILEVIQKLLAVHEPLPEFFNYTSRLMRALNDADVPEPRIFLAHFLIRISQELGFAWSVAFCNDCQAPGQQFPVRLQVQHGALRCRSCPYGASDQALILNQQELDELQRLLVVDPASLQSIQLNFQESLTTLLLKRLAHHTETILELKSLKWYV